MNNVIGNTSYARLGVWDGGAVRTTHNEFNTGDNLVIQRDNSLNLNDHATHVSGTMIARGANPSAKGMAWRAQLDAHDWNSDVAEMALAASRGMLISNHSYGFVTGWTFSGGNWIWYGDSNVSPIEDYKFGFYDNNARKWDEIAYNAPYYLIVKSAGNDRNDGPGTSPVTAEKDGGLEGYDCISLQGTSKNILTVGAVNPLTSGYNGPNSVIMSAFSSWGPTDDGRIKPDICGAGVGVFSPVAFADDAYSTLSGTSMSTPNVSGSLLLLQEHYENENGTGDFMKAATLKALVIHTADEAGTFEGPDYSFGWGLMNAATAAQLISDDAQQNNELINEDNLSNGEIYTKTFSANGNEPLILTITWTDPAGTSPQVSLDPTDLMIVNDLDMRISDGTTTFMPYVLDPANPSFAATTGDNFRDNVEKIYIANPDPDKIYTLTLTHKGGLVSGSQDFSLIVSGVETQPVFDLDVSIIQINGFDALGCNQKINPIIGVKNNGNNTITSFVIQYQLNDGSVQNFNWVGILEAGNITEINLPELVVAPGNAQEFIVSATNPNGLADENPFNNQRTKEFTAISAITQFPYSESFENGSGGWLAGGENSDWELGIPQGEFIENASDGQHAWITNLDGNYSNNQNSYLLSPLLDFTDLGSVSLNVDIFRYTEPQWDGAQLQVSTDCGASWNTVGGLETGVNWYNSNAAQLRFEDFDEVGWSGELDTSWVNASHSLDEFAGESNVKLRFLFRSDGSVSREGFGVDNFMITGTLKDEQTITFTDLPGVNYSDEKTILEATASSGLPVSFSSSDINIAQVQGNELILKKAGQVMITAQQAGDQSFKSAPSVSRVLTISKADLIAKADQKNKFYLDFNPALTITYEGFVNGDDATILNEEPQISTIATQTSSVGIYPITLSGGADDNYNITLENSTLEVIPQQITQLLLVDSDTDEVIQELNDNDQISFYELSNRNFSIMAVTQPGKVGQVRFELDGPLSVSKLESVAPYTLFGDQGEGAYNGLGFPAGAYTIKVSPFAIRNDSSSIGISSEINFEIIDLGTLQISQINLIDADTDEVIQTIQEGDIIALPNLTTRNLSIGVVTDPATIGSVQMILEGELDVSNTENTAPYSLFGDVNGPDYEGNIFPTGNYSFTTKTFAEPNGAGFEGETQTINFEIREFVEISVAELILVNADTDQPISILSEGLVLDIENLSATNLSIVANTSPDKVGSVKFELQGPVSQTKTESIAPYTLFGDRFGPDYAGGIFLPGQYSVKVTPYSEAGARGSAGTPMIINFEIKGEQTPILVNELNLIDADQDQIVLTLTDGMVIDMNTLNQSQITIAANTTDKVGSVKMDLNGPIQHSRVESIKPFTLYGDQNGIDFSGAHFCPGFYTITITPYELSRMGGIQGEILVMSFQVVNSLIVPELVLINAATDQPITVLTDNSSFNLDEIGQELSIQANTNCAKSIQFTLYNSSGEIIHSKLENQAPYTLFGDKNGDYFSWIPLDGSYRLEVTPYSEAQAAGVNGISKIINFNLTSQSVITKESQELLPNKNDLNDQTEIKIYPNPSAEFVKLTFGNDLSSEGVVEIINQNGKLIYSKDIQIEQNQELQINLNTILSEGAYYLRILTGNKTLITKKIIKH